MIETVRQIIFGNLDSGYVENMHARNGCATPGPQRAKRSATSARRACVHA